MLSDPDTPICQHFLRGTCKFRQNCRFRHSNPGATPAGGVKPSKPILYNEESIKLDMQLETWPLSCYSPEKDVYPPLNIIAGVDSSPEEVRMEYYKARSSPALMHAFISQISQMINQVNARKLEIVDNAKAIHADFLLQVKQFQEVLENNPFGAATILMANAQATPFQAQSPFSQPTALIHKPTFGSQSLNATQTNNTSKQLMIDAPVSQTESSLTTVPREQLEVDPIWLQPRFKFGKIPTTEPPQRVRF